MTFFISLLIAVFAFNANSYTYTSLLPPGSSTSLLLERLVKKDDQNTSNKKQPKKLSKKKSERPISKAFNSYKRIANGIRGYSTFLVIALGTLLFLFAGRQGWKSKNAPYLPGYKFKHPQYDPMEIYRKPSFKNSSSVFLGVNEKAKPYFTNFKRLTQNILLLAPPNMGKSTQLQNLILNFQLRGLPVFFIDPSGDEKIIGALRNQAKAVQRENDIFVIDFQSEDCPTIGLLTPFPKDNSLTVAGRLLDGLGFSLELAGDAKHYIQLESVYATYIVDFLFDHNITPRNVYRFIVEPQFRVPLIENFVRKYPTSHIPQQYAYFEKNKKFSESSHNLRTALEKFLLQDPVDRIVNANRPDITFFSAAQKGQTIIFKIPVDKYPFDAKQLGKIIIANIARLMAYRNELAEPSLPCGVFIDEFVSFVNASFFSLLSRNRKAGICVTLATQSLGQLEQIGVHNTSNLRSNLITQCRNRLVGYQDDDREARYWSDRCRAKTITEEIERISKRGLFGTREGLIRKKKDVPWFHSDNFKGLREGEFWMDFVDDPDNEDDPRSFYGQGVCFTPQLPYSQIPPPVRSEDHDDEE